MSISGVVGGREGGGGKDGVVVVGGTGVGRWIGLHRRCSGPQLAFISHCFAFFPRAWRICPASNCSFVIHIIGRGRSSLFCSYVSEVCEVHVIVVGLTAPSTSTSLLLGRGLHEQLHLSHHTTSNLSTMASDSCATCAQSYGAPSEKPLFPGRTLPCCSRTICARCLNQNKRYETYCPYCQITTAPSSLPQGLRDPPAYSSLEPNVAPPEHTSDDETLPAYQAGNYAGSANEKGGAAPAEDVLHFVAPDDSMRSLALAYSVPIAALRKTNNIYSDHLVQARKTILIPGEHYKGGVSLSPRPLESEEEEIKKNKVRRWMMACKVAE